MTREITLLIGFRYFFSTLCKQSLLGLPVILLRGTIELKEGRTVLRPDHVLQAEEVPFIHSDAYLSCNMKGNFSCSINIPSLRVSVV